MRPFRQLQSGSRVRTRNAKVTSRAPPSPQRAAMKEEGSYPLFGTGIASHQASELGECGGSEGPGKPGPGRGYWEQQTLQGACACAEGRTWGCRALPGGVGGARGEEEGGGTLGGPAASKGKGARWAGREKDGRRWLCGLSRE